MEVLERKRPTLPSWLHGRSCVPRHRSPLPMRRILR